MSLHRRSNDAPVDEKIMRRNGPMNHQMVSPQGGATHSKQRALLVAIALIFSLLAAGIGPGTAQVQAQTQISVANPPTTTVELGRYSGSDVAITSVQTTFDEAGDVTSISDQLKNVGARRANVFEVEVFIDGVSAHKDVYGANSTAVKVEVGATEKFDFDLAAAQPVERGSTLEIRYTIFDKTAVTESRGVTAIGTASTPPETTEPTTPPETTDPVTTPPETTLEETPGETTPPAEEPTPPTSETPEDPVYRTQAFGGIRVSEPIIERENPSSMVVTVEGSSDEDSSEFSLFERALFRVQAPNSVLNTEDYKLDITQIEDGVELAYRVIRHSRDYVEVEVYPVKDGQRVSSAKVPEGSEITVTGNVGDNAEIQRFELDIYGRPGTKVEEPAELDQILVPGAGTVGECTTEERFWVSVKPNAGAIGMEDENGTRYNINGDYIAEYDVAGNPTGRVLQVTQNFSSDVAVSADNRTMYAMALGSTGVLRIKVYDIASGNEINSYEIQNPGGYSNLEFNSLSLAPGGEHLYVGSVNWGKQSPVFKIGIDGTGLEEIATTNGNTNWGGDFITLPDGSTLGAQMNGNLVMWPGEPDGVPEIVGTIRDVEGSTAGKSGTDQNNFVHGLAYVDGHVIFVESKRGATWPEIGVGRLDVTPAVDDNIDVYDYEVLVPGSPEFPGMADPNQARANWGLTSTRESNPCPSPEFVVKKEAVQPTATKLEDDRYAADYTVTVANPSGEKGSYGQILDYPYIPEGFDLVGVEVDGQPVERLGGTPAEGHIPGPESGSYLVSEGGELEAQTQTSFSVRMFYRPKADITGEQWMNVGACENTTGGNPSRTGFPNVVSLEGEPKEVWDDNDACVTFQDRDVYLALEKVDYEDNTVELDAGFTIYAAGPDGELTDEVVAELDTLDVPGTEGYKSAQLKADKLYYLVEMRSPAGYELLAQPVLFRIITDDDGNQQVQFYDPETIQPMQDGGSLVNVFKNEDEESSSVAYIQVADVQSGRLPKTGGFGIAPQLLTSALLIGAGALFARRRNWIN